MASLISGRVSLRTPASIAWLITRMYVLFGTVLAAAMLVITDHEPDPLPLHLTGLLLGFLQAESIILISAFALFHLTLRASTEVFQAQTEALQEQMETMQKLAIAAEFRDGATRSHTYRVGQYCEAIALELGKSPTWARLLNLAAQLHDIGKVGIPDHVLHKRSKLDAHEQSIMQMHVAIGVRLLSGAHSPILQLAEEIVQGHHERWDGRGYPQQLMETQIPLSARICAVADVFDALVSSRPYKESWTLQAAADELIMQSGRHFDPDEVDAFARAFPKIKAIVEASETDAAHEPFADNDIDLLAEFDWSERRAA